MAIFDYDKFLQNCSATATRSYYGSCIVNNETREIFILGAYSDKDSSPHKPT